MSNKAAETTRNITKAFGPGTANEQTVQWWFKKFCKRDESLEDEEHSSRPSEVDNHQLRESSKLILLQLYKKLPKNSTLTKLWSFSIRNKLEQWKSSISGCFMSWRQIKKIIILKCCLLLFYTTTRTISPSDCDVWQKVDVIGQLAMTSSVVGPRRSSEAVPKAKLTPKNRSWSLSGGLLPVWSTTAFWIPVKPLYLSSMLSKSMRWTKNCSRHWSKDGPNSSPRQRLTTSRTTNISKVEQIGLQSFALSTIFAWLLVGPITTSSSMLTTFCQESSSTTSRMQKMLSKCLSNPEARIFTI